MSVLRLPVLAFAFAIAPAMAQPLSLEAALRAGETESPRLAAQRHAVHAADQLLGRASELPDPRLRFGIDNLPATRENRFRYNRDFMTMGTVGLMQEFPNQAKREARGARSERLRDLEQAALVAQGAALKREIARAWFDLHFAMRTRIAAEALVGQFEAQAEAVAAGVARGQQGTTDSFMLRGAAEQARDRVIELERSVERARIALSVWIGDAAARPLAAPPDTSRLPQAPSGLLARVSEHPQMRVIDDRESLARAEADLARSTKISDWSLQVGFSHREPAYSNMVSVMVSMDLPWDQERRQDRDVAARLAEIERTRAQREDLRRVIEGEIRAWLADFDTASRRIQRFHARLLPLARDRVDAALAAYRGGRAELGPVLEARRALTETALSLIAAEARQAGAWADLSYVFSREDLR